jgi:hypothetical protein
MKAELVLKMESEDGSWVEEPAGLVTFPERPVQGDIVLIGSRQGHVQSVTWIVTQHGRGEGRAEATVTVRFG